MGNVHDKASKNFTVIEKLNVRGAFGRIFLVRDKRDNEIYVMKKIGFRKNFLKHLGDEETLTNIKQEAALLENLKHKHIVSYKAFWTEGIFKPQACIVMEYCSKGDLKGYLEDQFKLKKVLKLEQVMKWFWNMCKAVDYIHRQDIWHRDLKPANIFLDAKGSVKIGDFGLAKVLKHHNEVVNSTLGTPLYMAPEIFTHKPYTSKVDNYALGCILYLMITGMDYLPGAKIEKCAIASRYPPYVVQPLYLLVAALLSPEPEKRPDFPEIYKQIERIRMPPPAPRTFIPRIGTNRGDIQDDASMMSFSDLLAASGDWRKWFSCRPTFIVLIILVLATWVVGTCITLFIHSST